MLLEIFELCAFIGDERNRLSRIAAAGLVYLAIGLVTFALLQRDTHGRWAGALAIGCLALAWGCVKVGDWYERRQKARKPKFSWLRR